MKEQTKETKKATAKKEKSMFDNLYAIDVNEYVEQKNKLNYLSWTYAWAEVKKHYPNANYEIKRFGENNLPYVYDENTGYMVFTSVTIDGLTHEMWLPVMDGANKAMKSKSYTYNTKYKSGVIVEAATMFDINKTIMRCLVKNLAMFGLGLYIYAGEDLPEEDKKARQEEAEKEKNLKEIKNELWTLIKAYCTTSGQNTEDVYTVLEKHIGKKLTEMTCEDAIKLIEVVNVMLKGGEI